MAVIVRAPLGQTFPRVMAHFGPARRVWLVSAHPTLNGRR